MVPERETLEKRERKLADELERAAEALKEMGAEKIVLVGSMASGTSELGGDIDLVVVMRTEKRFLDRLKEVCLRNLPRVAMDMLVYTPEEFEGLKESSPFLSHALKGGKCFMPFDPRKECRRRMEQARFDLDDAEYSARGYRYNLACFLAQQAAEKTLKAYLYLAGHRIVWGYSVAELMDDAGRSDPAFYELRDRGSFLDRFYIPTRYPNGLPGGTPREAFNAKDASEALSATREIIDFVSGKTAGPE